MSKKAEATAFLVRTLAGGAAPAREVGRLAREHGLTTRALRSARATLGITIERHGFGRGSASEWSLPNPQTRDGYEILELALGPCSYCDQAAGPPGPQSGAIYLIRNSFVANFFEPLHQDCAKYWFDWLGAIPREMRDRLINGARARMRNRVKGAGGHGQG